MQTNRSAVIRLIIGSSSSKMGARSLQSMCNGFTYAPSAKLTITITKIDNGYYGNGKMCSTISSGTSCQHETESTGRQRNSYWMHYRPRKNFPGTTRGCNPSTLNITISISIRDYTMSYCAKACCAASQTRRKSRRPSSILLKQREPSFSAAPYDVSTTRFPPVSALQPFSHTSHIL